MFVKIVASVSHSKIQYQEAVRLFNQSSEIRKSMKKRKYKLHRSNDDSAILTAATRFLMDDVDIDDQQLKTRKRDKTEKAISDQIEKNRKGREEESKLQADIIPPPSCPVRSPARSIDRNKGSKEHSLKTPRTPHTPSSVASRTPSRTPQRLDGRIRESANRNNQDSLLEEAALLLQNIPDEELDTSSLLDVRKEKSNDVLPHQSTGILSGIFPMGNPQSLLPRTLSLSSCCDNESENEEREKECSLSLSIPKAYRPERSLPPPFPVLFNEKFPFSESFDSAEHVLVPILKEGTSLFLTENIPNMLIKTELQVESDSQRNKRVTDEITELSLKQKLGRIVICPETVSNKETENIIGEINATRTESTIEVGAISKTQTREIETENENEYKNENFMDKTRWNILVKILRRKLLLTYLAEAFQAASKRVTEVHTLFSSDKNFHYNRENKQKEKEKEFQIQFEMQFENNGRGRVEKLRHRKTKSKRFDDPVGLFSNNNGKCEFLSSNMNGNSGGETSTSTSSSTSIREEKRESKSAGISDIKMETQLNVDFASPVPLKIENRVLKTKKTVPQYSSSLASSLSQDTLLKLDPGSINSRKKVLIDSVQLSKTTAFRINIQNSSRIHLQSSQQNSQRNQYYGNNNSQDYSPSFRPLRPLSQQLLPSDRMRHLRVMLSESNERVSDLTNQISSNISTLSGIGVLGGVIKNVNKNKNRNLNDFNGRNAAVAFAEQLGCRKYVQYICMLQLCDGHVYQLIA